MLVTVVFQVAAPEANWSRLVAIVLQATTLATAAWTAGATHVVVRAASWGAVILALGTLVVGIVGGEVPRGATAIVSLLLVAFAPAVIATGVVRDLRESGAVSLRTLTGVLAIYLLIGVSFSFLYGAIDALGHEPFFAQTGAATASDHLYFSFTTLSTVGFGDLTPGTEVGRTLAVCEALLGQIYLVTIVALIVANMSGFGRQRS